MSQENFLRNPDDLIHRCANLRSTSYSIGEQGEIIPKKTSFSLWLGRTFSSQTRGQRRAANHLANELIRFAERECRLGSESSLGKQSDSFRKILSSVRIHPEKSAYLKQIDIALQLMNGTAEKTSPASPVIDGLERLAISWKESHPKLFYENRQHLNERERHQLKKLAQYAPLAQELLRDKHLQNRIFSAILLSNVSVSLVAHCPVLMEKCFAAHVDGALGRCGKKILRLQKERDGDTTRKFVQIKIEKEWKDLPFGKENLTVHSSLMKRIEEIFASFKKLHPKTSHWCATPEEGFTHWNPYTLIRRDEKGNKMPIDTSLKGYAFLKSLPAYEILSYEEAEERYGGSFQAGKDHYVLRASGLNPSLDIDGWHGYGDFIRCFIDESGKERYQIFPIGKYLAHWPRRGNPKDMAGVLGKTDQGIVSYPDPNDQDIRRIHCYMPPIPMTREASDILAELIRLSMIEAMEGRSYFQLSGENCIYYSQNLIHLLHETLTEKGYEPGEHFDLTLLDDFTFDIRSATPSNPVMRLILWLLNLCKHSNELQRLILFLFGTLLGLWRKHTITVMEGDRKRKVAISVLSQNPDVIRKGRIYMPARALQCGEKFYFGMSGKAQEKRARPTRQIPDKKKN